MKNRKEALLSKAEAQEKRGHTQQALDLYLEYLKEFNHSDIMLKVAFLYKELGDHLNYFEYLFTASQYDNADAYYYLSQYYKNCGEEDNAKKMLEKARELGHPLAKKEKPSPTPASCQWKVIINNNCNLCQVCINMCFLNLIYIENGKIVVDDENCIWCTQCIRACPNLAISIIEVK